MPTMSYTFVIFGASGDLTNRKLIPALYRLFRQRRLPEGTRIVGCARSEFTSESWRHQLAETTAQHVGQDFSQDQWGEFAPLISYVPLDIEQSAHFMRLVQHLEQLDASSSPPVTRIFYLATAPSLYAPAVAQLGASGLAQNSNVCRLVVEKPFGTDLESAKQLNAALHQVFSERQVYRIDHYLGKETVQNLLVMRFANGILEPVWNRNYVDHVQITVAEEVVVGRRGAYYDQAGVLRDMFQNHLLQLMMITAMEAPVRYQSALIHDEKVKVLQAVRPLKGADFATDTLRAQYTDYAREPGVAASSQTATFAVVKLYIDNWRWQGVPFYLRSGKALSCRTTQIVVNFRKPPHSLFAGDKISHIDNNRLVLQLQPAEGMQLHLLSKVPDAGMRIRVTNLDYRFDQDYSGELPDAYQRLLLDAAAGDTSLFARSDEVELAWGIVDPIVEAWHSHAAPPLEGYESGQWGPESSTQWMRSQGREWFDVCPVLH
jgi:glucose-6-phosphate 1-dehydrogenase